MAPPFGEDKTDKHIEGKGRTIGTKSMQNNITELTEKEPWYSEFGYWLVIVLVLVLPIFSIGENLGLYFDAVLPDYTATQLLHSQQYQEKWFVSWPLLTQLYHGSINMFISALVIMITGTTSVVQHRIINALIIVLCLWVIYNLLAREGVSRTACKLGVFIFACMPTVLTFCLTQYYIELPGTFLMLCALLLLSRNDTSYLNTWAVFALLGFAFYSYFNFLFFYPGFLLITLWKEKDKLAAFIASCMGMLLGASLYLFGYLQAYVLNRICGVAEMIAVCFVVYMLLLLLLEVGIYRLVLQGKMRYCLMIGAATVFAAMIAVLLCWNQISSALESLNVAGESASIGQRIRLVYDTACNSLSGISAEKWFFGYSVMKYQKVPVVLLLIATVVYVVVFIIDKEFRKTTSAWKYLVVIIAYLCCCIPMITRMQTQHFVPICFLMLFAGTLELAETTSWITGRILEIRQVKKGTQTVCVLCCVVLSLLFLNDRFMILNEIEVTGGNGFYTSQINKLADDALENFEKGEKEIYLFPEWGFMSGFNYITNNHVAFSTNSSSENMKKLMNEGYDVLVVYWNDSDTKTYSDLLNDAGAETIIKYAYVGNEGRADFYKLEGSMQE